MASITATEARKLLYRLIDEVNDSHQPVHITGKRNTGVLVSESDWQSVMETLHLSQIPGMKDSIIKGMGESLDDCPEDPGW